MWWRSHEFDRANVGWLNVRQRNCYSFRVDAGLQAVKRQMLRLCNRSRCFSFFALGRLSSWFYFHSKSFEQNSVAHILLNIWHLLLSVRCFFAFPHPCQHLRIVSIASMNFFTEYTAPLSAELRLENIGTCLHNKLTEAIACEYRAYMIDDWQRPTLDSSADSSSGLLSYKKNSKDGDNIDIADDKIPTIASRFRASISFYCWKLNALLKTHLSPYQCTSVCHSDQFYRQFFVQTSEYISTTIHWYLRCECRKWLRFLE